MLTPSWARLCSFENRTLKGRLSWTRGVTGWKTLGEVDWGRILLQQLELLPVQKKLHQVRCSVGRGSTAGSL